MGAGVKELKRHTKNNKFNNFYEKYFGSFNIKKEVPVISKKIDYTNGEKYLNTSSKVNMTPDKGALKAADKPADAPEAIRILL